MAKKRKSVSPPVSPQVVSMWYSTPSRVATVQMWLPMKKAEQSMPSSFKKRL